MTTGTFIFTNTSFTDPSWIVAAVIVPSVFVCVAAVTAWHVFTKTQVQVILKLRFSIYHSLYDRLMLSLQSIDNVQNHLILFDLLLLM